MGEKEQRVTKTCKQVVSLLAWIILGNFVYALGVAVFVVPGGLVTGGTTGIGLAVQHAVGIPLAPFVGAFNLVMFAVGLVALGKTFALSTLASTIAYPSLLGCVQGLLGDTVLTTDPFLCALFGGLCIGCGLGLVIRLGASTGGMDIPPLVLNKRFGLPISGTMYVFDFLILLVQVPFTDLNRVMYGIVLVMVYTLTLDKLLSLGKRRVQLDVVTRRVDTLRRALLEHTGPKTTMVVMPVECAGLPANMIRLILDPRDLHAVEGTIHNADGEAQIVENRIGEMKTK